MNEFDTPKYTNNQDSAEGEESMRILKDQGFGENLSEASITGDIDSFATSGEALEYYYSCTERFMNDRVKEEDKVEPGKLKYTNIPI